LYEQKPGKEASMVDLAERGAAMVTTELPHQSTDSVQSIWEVWEHLEIPPGFRAEILRGEIILSPTPIDTHNLLFGILVEMLLPVTVPKGWVVTNSQCIVLPSQDEGLLPDLIVTPKKAMKTGHWRKSPEDLLLVGEITSPSNRERDTKLKLESYAKAQIPMYLLVDPHHGDGEITLYSEPGDKGAYDRSSTVKFGATLRIPDPFEVDIDTREFL
jgi:Uma2 family endonuclease